MSPLVESNPGTPLREVWIYLSPAEAAELRQALDDWAVEDPPDPEWHTHIGGVEEPEVTIAIGPRPPELSQRSGRLPLSLPAVSEGDRRLSRLPQSSSRSL